MQKDIVQKLIDKKAKENNLICLNAYSLGLEDMKVELKSMKLISVEKELPKVDIEDGDFKTSDHVIARFTDGKHHWFESATLKLWFEDETPEWYYFYEDERVIGSKVTHWMHAPEITK